MRVYRPVTPKLCTLTVRPQYLYMGPDLVVDLEHEAATGICWLSCHWYICIVGRGKVRVQHNFCRDKSTKLNLKQNLVTESDAQSACKLQSACVSNYFWTTETLYVICPQG